MKKLKCVVMVFFCVVLFVIASLQVVVNIRKQSITSREALSMETLEQLSFDMGSVEAGLPESITDGVEASETILSTLPRRLEGVATREMALEKFVTEASKRDMERRALNLSGAKVAESVLWTVGADNKATHVAFNIGWAHLMKGEFDEARGYFQDIIDSPFNEYTLPYHRMACGNLAWLEDDPEKAARLLELSCQGKPGMALLDAAELCRLTGSDELAEHYSERLRSEFPEFANRLDN